jgi:hypothetical protein
LLRTNCGLGYSGKGLEGSTFSAHGVNIFPETGFQLFCAGRCNKRQTDKKEDKNSFFIVHNFKQKIVFLNFIQKVQNKNRPTHSIAGMGDLFACYAI